MSSQRFTDSTASVLLDAIRGIAAFLVLLDHWRSAFFVDFASIRSHRLLFAPLYIVSGAGHQAVIIFFVLSGYLISGAIFRSFQKHQWNWGVYAVHRLVRLWIVLLPALLLGAIWDHIGIYLHYAPNLYSGADYNHMTPDVTRALSLVDFLGNVAFVQTIAVPTFGSNGALWSLANEFWYYALFPLAACVVARVAKTRTHIVLCIAAFAVIATGITKEILLAFPVWLVGALLHAVPSRIPAAVWFRALAAVSYTAFFFGMSALDHMGWIGQGILGDSLLGLGTFGFIWVLLSAKEQADKTMLNQFVRKTASFSYTLYLAHTPILIFTVALLARDTRWFPDTGVAALAICVLILVVAYAWLLATVTEFKTDKVRSWAERTLIRRSADAGVT